MGTDSTGAARTVGKRIAPVAVIDMDRARNVLVGEDGRRYREAESNTWVAVDDPSVVYLGTGRHGGGIVLRALYVRSGGEWVNATTGKPAPEHVTLPAATT